MRLKTMPATVAAALAMTWAVLVPGVAAAGLPADNDSETGVTAAHCLNHTVFTTGTGFHVALPSTTPGGAETNCILTIGDRGAGVFVLQDALRRCYGQNIVWDAIYGPRTADAVRNVQRFHGIAVDGVYGPQTRAAMTWPKYRDSDNQYDHCWR